MGKEFDLKSWSAKYWATVEMETGQFCLFSDSEFEDACKELEEPQTEEWEFFVESHGVTIYRQYNEV